MLVTYSFKPLKKTGNDLCGHIHSSDQGGGGIFTSICWSSSQGEQVVLNAVLILAKAINSKQHSWKNSLINEIYVLRKQASKQ